MKKKIAVIMLALIMCFAAVGCENGNGGGNVSYELKVVKSLIECEIGKTPDWSAAVKLMNGSQEVPFDSSAVSAQLTSGYPDEEAVCNYNVSYEYGGKVYGPVKIRVSYKKAGGGEVEPPEEPDDPSNMTDAQREALENAVAKQYNAYNCVINLSFDDDSMVMNKAESFESNKTSDKIVINEKHTQTYSVTIGDETQSASEEWYLSRTKKLGDESAASDMISVYLDMSSEENPDTWYTRTVQYSEFINNSTLYGDFRSVGFQMNSLDIDLEHFDAKEGADGVYFVRNKHLEEIAEKIFGLGASDFPESLELKLDNDGNVYNITYNYESRGMSSDDDSRVVATIDWSDFETVTVTLPEAEEYTMPMPEHVAPSEKEAVSGEELNTLNAAFSAEYNNVSYTSYQNLQSIITRQKGKSAGNKRYNDQKIYVSYMGKETLAEAQEVYASIKQNGSVIYQMNGEQGDYIKQVSSLGAKDLVFYIQPTEMQLDGSWFAADNTQGAYVITKTALPALKTAVESMFTGMDKFYSCEPVTFTVKLDSNNKLTEWYMLFECQETINSVAGYWEYSYTYADIDNTNIVLPAGENDNITAVTSEQKAAFMAAIASEKFDNVTITETASNSVATFDGNKSIRAYTEDFMGIPFPVTDEYERTEDGNYLRWDWDYTSGDIGEDGNPVGAYVSTALTHEDVTVDGAVKRGYDYIMVHFHFDAFTDNILSKMQYDADAQTYILRSGTDITDAEIKEFVKSFIYYMYQSDIVYKGVDVTVKDGYVTSVRLIVESSTGSISSVSAAFTEYGTTEVELEKDKPEENPDGESKN